MRAIETRRSDHDDLAVQHIALVHHVVRRMECYLSDQLDHDELVSAGTYGLLLAARAFDARRNLKFSTYAVPRIRGAILDELRRLDTASRGTRRRQRLVDGARAVLANRLGRHPSCDEVAATIGISPTKLRRWELAIAQARTVSVEELVASDRHDGLASPEVSESLGDALHRIENRQSLERALAALEPRAREVVVRYYWRDQQLHEIADALGVTESRVSQIKAAAIARLRSNLLSCAA